MAFKKIPYAEYKQIQKKISGMNQREMSIWLADMFNEVYKNGYEDGYQECLRTPSKETEDWQISIAIRSTEGVGPVLHKRIMDSINKLCFDENRD